MKLSIQNHGLMVTLPQAKAKSRALSRYLSTFGFLDELDDPDVHQPIEEMAHALRTGGTMYADDFFWAFSKLVEAVPTSKKVLNTDFKTLSGDPRRFTDPETYMSMGKTYNKVQDEHNAVVALLNWCSSRGIGNASLAAILADGIMRDEPLSETLSELRSSNIELPDDMECEPEYVQYAFILKLLRDLGQPQLVDELLRVEGVAA